MIAAYNNNKGNPHLLPGKINLAFTLKYEQLKNTIQMKKTSSMKVINKDKIKNRKKSLL